jgi:hypothetical protein
MERGPDWRTRGDLESLMSKLITELDTFPDYHTITVPEGTDSMAAAAEAIEAIVQKLGNRTRYLRDHVLFRNAFNILTGGAGFEFPEPATEGGAWRLLMRLIVGPGDYVNMVNVYSGTSETSAAAAQFAIVYNAEWNGSAWEQSRPARKSWIFKLGYESGGSPFAFGGKAAGAGPWTTWDESASVGGTNINLAAGDLVYGVGGASAGRTAVTVMGSGSAHAGGHDGGRGSMLTDGSLGHAFVDLRFPPNWDASSATIEAVHYQNTTAPATVQLVERVVNFASPAAATQTVLVQDVGPASTGYKKRTLSLNGITFDQTAKEYRLVWIPGDTGDAFEGWRVLNWKDCGPRNTLA